MCVSPLLFSAHHFGGFVVCLTVVYDFHTALTERHANLLYSKEFNPLLVVCFFFYFLN